MKQYHLLLVTVLIVLIGWPPFAAYVSKNRSKHPIMWKWLARSVFVGPIIAALIVIATAHNMPVILCATGLLMVVPISAVFLNSQGKTQILEATGWFQKDMSR